MPQKLGAGRGRTILGSWRLLARDDVNAKSNTKGR